MFQPEKTMEVTYEKRIDALRTTKKEHNDIKLKKFGYHDVDDHGIIPWFGPNSWKPQPNHPSGGVFGPKAIGENFRKWLDVHPVYIQPMSAVAGAWAGMIRVGGWKPEDKPNELAPLHKEYNDIFVGIEAMNHLSPDMKIGLDLGWGGLLKKVRYYRSLNHPTDTGFYDGEEALVLGIQDWIRKHVVKARLMAVEETVSEIRDNLLFIADMNEWLVDNPPRTLREAVQFLTWFQSVDRMYFAGGAMGQLDELLRPYYEADKAYGLIPDDEEVVWYIASLLFNDTHYSQIGGQAADGHDLTSRMSFLILEAMHQLRIPANIALRVHDGMDPDLLHLAVKYLFQDGTGVCYSLSGGLDKGFARNGVPIELARMRAKVGCNWTALPGIEYPLQDVNRLCMVSPFLHAFDEIVADPSIPRSMEELWKRYIKHLAKNIDIFKRGYAIHMERHAANSPEIVLNLFCHGPIERGLDVAAGGVDIYDLALDGVGLPTVADSFAAIEQRVVDEKRLTWEQLAEVLKNDYAGAENIRLMLKNIPRYGTGDSRADWWAKRISETYSDMVHSTPTCIEWCRDYFHTVAWIFSASICQPHPMAVMPMPLSPTAPIQIPGLHVQAALLPPRRLWP
jgi:pyruvate-formate lyase